MSQAITRISEMIDAGGQHYVVTPNPEHVVMAQDDKEFKEVLNAADLSIPDGVGLIWASKWSVFSSQFTVRSQLRLEPLKV